MGLNISFDLFQIVTPTIVTNLIKNKKIVTTQMETTKIKTTYIVKTCDGTQIVTNAINKCVNLLMMAKVFHKNVKSKKIIR